MSELVVSRIIAGTLILGILIANLSERRSALRSLVYGLMVAFHAAFLYRFLNYYNFARAANPGVDIDTSRMGIGIVLTAAFAVAGLSMLVPAVRQTISRFFPRRELVTNDGVTTTRGFDPNSMVHMVALVGCIYLLAVTILEFVLSGGLAALAANFTGITTEDLWIQAIAMMFFALIGVGIGIRRGIPATLARLGLRSPTIVELLMAGVTAFALILLAFTVNMAWTLLAPRDVVEQQTVLSQEIGNSVTTLTLGFMLALTAALGEEIAFRGALQPIFGLVPTALLFALIHIQYTLTLASLLILCVGLGFGWLRKRYNTTTSIVAHFLYDFSLVSLLVIARYGIHILRPGS